MRTVNESHERVDMDKLGKSFAPLSSALIQKKFHTLQGATLFSAR